METIDDVGCLSNPSLPVSRFTLLSAGQRLVTGALVHSHGRNPMFCQRVNNSRVMSSAVCLSLPEVGLKWVGSNQTKISAGD